MTPIADMIEQMLTEGVPQHVIVLAVRTAERAAVNGKSGGSPVDTTAEKRRAYDRERKAAERKVRWKSGGSPVDTETASSLTSISDSEIREEKKEEAKRKNGRTLPVEWRPSESHYAEGAALHQSRDQVDAKAEEMRLWARANGHRAVARKLDWDATFSGWMRRDWGNSKGTRNGRNSGPPADKSVVAAADRILERMRSFDSSVRQDRSGDGGFPGENPRRLLSQG